MYNIKHKLKASNSIAITGSDEVTALSVSYCKREDSHTLPFTPKYLPFLRFEQGVCYHGNIRLFRISVTPNLQPIAWIWSI